MIAETDLLTALQKGTFKATEDYLKWSGGTFLDECAGEGFMVASMAQAVMKTSSPPPYLCLEYCLSTLKDDLNQPIIGRLPDRLKGSGRIDMAILNREKQLKFAIEAKCCTSWTENYCNDLERLMILRKKLRQTSTYGSLQSCIFIAFVSSYSISGLKKAKENLNDKISDWKDNMHLCYQKKYGEISISFNTSTKLNILETNEYAKVATSLCCIIK